jgi:hypothetical protein
MDLKISELGEKVENDFPNYPIRMNWMTTQDKFTSTVTENIKKKAANCLVL